MAVQPDQQPHFSGADWPAFLYGQLESPSPYNSMGQCGIIHWFRVPTIIRGRSNVSDDACFDATGY